MSISTKSFMNLCQIVRWSSLVFVLMALYFTPYEILRGNIEDVVWNAAIIALAVPTMIGAHLAYEDEIELASNF